MSCGGSAPDQSGTDLTESEDFGRARVAAVVPLVPVWRVDRTFDYAVPPKLVPRVEPGALVRVPFGHRRVRGIVSSVRDGPPAADLEEIASVSFPVPVASGALAELLEWVARRYVVPKGRAFSLAVPPRVRVRPPAPERLTGGPEPSRILGYDNGAALVATIERGGSGVWCVWARPGEDRGELIAELVAAAGRAGGGGALVAVPEIRYGSAVLDRLAGHWPGVARLESTRDDMERANATAMLAAGHGFGAGGRSSVLAPMPELRLLVLDEEHHTTYKEDRSPRYDARQVAMERARLQTAVCVFVSMAPSVELGATAAEGRAGWVRPSRADLRAARPIVELIDRPDDRSLSHALHERVRDALRSGARVALLAPRRGFARALWCAGCRRSLRCPACEAGLFFDMTPRRVRCGRCGYSSEPPTTCPSCGANEWRHVGAGSERLAEQLARMFPRARVRRVDPAVLEGLPGPEAPSFEDADIYLTTWIGTKTSLRPDVSVVGILDADALIRRPDFRAAERAYQALAEMAEWAGPADSAGRLVVQTAEPGHHALQALVRADYEFFLERELLHRKELSYPPFTELVKITVRGPDAEAQMERISRAVRIRGARVLGPIRVPRSGSEETTLQVLIKSRAVEELADDLRSALVESISGARVSVDVDPR
jgi:primosomal protein N' (replication factor Y) (superfamily II helicase)